MSRVPLWAKLPRNKHWGWACDQSILTERRWSLPALLAALARLMKSQWRTGRMDEHDAYAIVGTISSAVTGTLLFTRGLLKSLEASGAGDILTIVSISGLPNVPLSGASVAFLAAKHGQAGLTDGLRQELRGRPVRVSALYPPLIDDVSPLDEEAWNAKRPADAHVSNRDIVETALFALSRPRHLTLASITIDSDEGGLLAR